MKMEFSDQELSKIKDKLDSLLSRLTKECSATNNENVPEWILPPRSCSFLQTLSELFPAPVSAFEFGSGCSTHALRAVCPQVVSIEDSQEWLEKTENSATGIKKRSGDTTQVIPLTICWSQARPFKSFDLEPSPEIIKRLQNSHIILVDSPPNPATREQALLTALKYCPPGAITILDDLNVGTAKRFSQRIARQNYPHLDFWYLPLDHHLGIFFKRSSRNEEICSYPTLKEIAGQWLRC